ncbi:MAG: 3-phosphoshikimate 1-carboxyvinyltransferase [Anaerovoracaceae bacterium]|jgi:3-phosphoshikimate 1-carboxyvinyltransferase
MDVLITPEKLRGTVNVPGSKSHGHRLLICGALAGEPDAVHTNNDSRDITVTRSALEHLMRDQAPSIDCGESGSTLRFLLPVTMALRDSAEFYGHGKLPQRPLSPLWEQMEEHGCRLRRGEREHICSARGRMHGGNFFLPGDISSQYISGLLLALPLTEEGGIIHLTSPLESAGYVEMTLQTLVDFSIEVERGCRDYAVAGGQKFIMPPDAQPEGDWSAAAFWIAANALGADIKCTGLSENSTQRDKEIVELAQAIRRRGTTVTATDIPDLVPILAVLMAATPGEHRIRGAGRLRLKESDRLEAMRDGLTALGAKVSIRGDGLLIEGSEQLHGGEVSGYNDHRIVMAMAIAATVCSGPVLIHGAEAVTKSYPAFFRDYATLNGKIKEV